MISYSARRTLQAVAAAFGVFCMLTMVVAVTYVHTWRVDLSPGERFTLSDHARDVLRDIDQPIHITAFIRTEDGRNPILKDLLWQARNESSRIRYDVVDINKNPALATRLGVSAYGAVVVESRSRRRDFTNPSETQLVSAILNVTRPSKQVAVISGHGECVLDDVDRRKGCSQMRSAILQESYRVEPLALASAGSVPRDVDILVIAGPKEDFLDNELEALGTYLDEGGKALVLLDPFRAPRLSAFLRDYGLLVGEDVILDPENRLAGGELLSAVITDVNRQHLVVATLKAPPVLSGMRGMTARSDEGADRQVVSLLRSGPRSWASYDRAVLGATSPPQFVAGRDRNGPFRIGVEVSQPARVSGKVGRGRRTVIVAYGDSDFATNRFFDYLGNKDLFLNSLNWLGRDELLIGNRPQAQPAGSKVLFISQSQLSDLFRWAVVILPSLYMLAGILVIVWRRLGP